MPSPMIHGQTLAGARGTLRGAPSAEVSTIVDRHRRACGSRARMVLVLLSGLIAIAVFPVTTWAQTALVEQSVPADPYATHIAEASQRFGIPAAWIRAVMRVESGARMRAISPKGAIGLMQVMPGTWAELRASYHLGNDPYDPRDNILAGAAYLRELHDHYGSPGFLAAYNAGPGRYEDYLKNGRSLPAETRAYVAALLPFVSGNKITEPVVVVTEDRQSWAVAPLFMVWARRISVVNPLQVKRRSGDEPTANSAGDISAIRPLAGDLFVTRSRTGEPQ